MSFFPDIEDGQLVPKEEPKRFTPKVTNFHGRMKEEDRLAELNNLGRSTVTEDFSDSPHLDK